jgi:hypothetical protein
MLNGMKALSLTLSCAIPGSLALLSTGCSATEGRTSNVSLLMPGTGTTSGVQSAVIMTFTSLPEVHSLSPLATNERALPQRAGAVRWLWS